MNKTNQVDLFRQQLKHYKSLIDEDISSYAKQVQATTLDQYGKNARTEIDAYLSILQRGGKRIRGALVMVGYEMSGGKNNAMILQAARAIEMLHAYMLIIDDIQDHSLTRRGGAAAHALLAQEHSKQMLSGDSKHFGISIAINSALAGAHAAQMILSNLSANDEDVIKVLGIVNRTMLVTAHGQTSDIINEVSTEVSLQDIEDVMEWKTAHYSFLNPLHVGMVLAGADCKATDAITEYALHTGKAFQITDDILGTFGSEFESGKSPLDDTREGKRTLLTLYALNHADNGNKNYLIQMLGNSKITKIEFERLKDIIVSTGALEYAQNKAQQHIDQAIESLSQHKDMWSTEGIDFLTGLASYLKSRRA